MIELTYRELDDWKYQVKEYFKIQTGLSGIDIVTEYISLQPDGLLRIKTYYAWNGSNWSSDKHAMIASLVHDALCQLMRMGLLSRTVFSKPVDALYRDIAIAEGLNKYRAGFRYRMLRWFGKSATYPEKNPRGQINKIAINYPIIKKP